MKNFINKKTSIFVVIFSALIVFVICSYLYLIPKIICSPKTIAFVQKAVADNCNAELLVTDPVLKTSLNSNISFKTPALTITKNGEVLLNLQNFNIEINFSKILSKKIVIDKLGADEIYADINKLQDLKIKESKEEEKKASPIKFDCLHTLFYIKKCAILYNTTNSVLIKLFAKNLEVSEGVEPKFLHFNIFLDLFQKVILNVYLYETNQEIY